jgi:hypothetical protein
LCCRLGGRAYKIQVNGTNEWSPHMDIGKISNSGLPIDALKLKKVKREEDSGAPSKGDKLEISEEAASLFNTTESKNFDEIRQRIQSGYYFQPEVTQQVVDAILRDPAFDQNT